MAVTLTNYLNPSDQIPPLCVAETLDPGQGIVDIWYYFYESGEDKNLFDEYGSILSGEEMLRYRALRFDRDRLVFLATRILIRSVLSRYAAVAPAEWRFGRGPYGKPECEYPAPSPTPSPPLFFNLANAHGLVVCAISTAYSEIGIDVERMDREVQVLETAEHHLAEPEIQRLRGLTGQSQIHEFFKIWTLKESYLKALGLGLSKSIRDFSFTFDCGRIRATFENTPPNAPNDWQFTLLTAHPNHLIALAANTRGGQLSLRTSRFLLG